MMRIKLAIISLVLFIIGCSNMPKIDGSNKTFQSRLTEYNSIKCCIDFSEMKSQPLEGGLAFNLEENKEKIISLTGPSYYKLLTLPKDGKEHKYALRSYLIKENQNHQHAAIPIMYFLDNKFNVLRKSKYEYIKYMHRSLRNDSNYYLYFKTNNDSNEKYMLITVDENSIGKLFTNSTGLYKTFSTSMIAGEAISTSNTSREKAGQARSSPSGVLEIDEFSYFLSEPPNYNYSLYF